jgi:folate-binding Fe-S cluster repair protein YgfZ
MFHYSFSMFQGRVLYDIIIYNACTEHQPENFLIECDVQVTQELVKYLKKYKLRRKVCLLITTLCCLYTEYPSKLSFYDHEF